MFYRNTFEAHINVDSQEKDRTEASYTFSDFADIVVLGFSELSRFLEQNNVPLTTNFGEMETGMVDGEKEPSLKWNPLWRHCGVCHTDFQPEYIIHLEHYREDLRVLFYLFLFLMKASF